MAFSAEELRVLRRALRYVASPALLPEREVGACRRLVQEVDETAGEAARQRAFLAADLDRYRAALPGAVSGYLEQLQEALNAGYEPSEADLSALRGLCAERTGPHEAARRAVLLVRATLPEARGSLFALSGGRDGDRLPAPDAEAGARTTDGEPEATPLLQRHGACEVPVTVSLEDLPELARQLDESEPPQPLAEKRSDMSDKDEPRRRPVEPGGPASPRPASPQPSSPRPGRPMPTPAEVFPPRRRPAPPSEGRVPATLLA